MPCRRPVKLARPSCLEPEGNIGTNKEHVKLPAAAGADGLRWRRESVQRLRPSKGMILRVAGSTPSRQRTLTAAMAAPAGSLPKPNGAQPQAGQKWRWMTCLLNMSRGEWRQAVSGSEAIQWTHSGHTRGRGFTGGRRHASIPPMEIHRLEVGFHRLVIGLGLVGAAVGFVTVAPEIGRILDAQEPWMQLAERLWATAARPMFGGLAIGWTIGIVAQWIAAGFIFGDRRTEADRRRERQYAISGLMIGAGIIVGANLGSTFLRFLFGDLGALGAPALELVGGIAGALAGAFLGAFAASLLLPKPR